MVVWRGLVVVVVFLRESSCSLKSILDLRRAWQVGRIVECASLVSTNAAFIRIMALLLVILVRAPIKVVETRVLARRLVEAAA